jgi:hypothetical protein
MATKKKSAQKEESIPGYKELLADLVGTIKDTMAKTRPFVDEKTFNAIWGIKKKKPTKKKSHERKKV